MSSNQKTYISWKEFHDDSRALSNKIKALGLEFKGMVVVTRGGLVPAAVISTELNIRNIEVYNVSSYDGKTSGELNVRVEPLQAIKDQGKGWLVVDELVDTGETYRFIKNQLPEAVFTAVYVKNKKNNKEVFLDLYVEEKDGSKWLCFPWDKEETE